jgi:hypothetical protein
MRRCSTWNTPDARANRPGDVRCDFRGRDVELGVVLPPGDRGWTRIRRRCAQRSAGSCPSARGLACVAPRGRAAFSEFVARPRFRQSPQRAAGRIDSIGHRTEPSGGCAPAPRDAFSRAGVVLHRTRPSVVPTSTWGPATSPSVARGLQGVGTARRSACVSRFFGRSRPFLLTDAPPDGRLRDAHH